MDHDCGDNFARWTAAPPRYPIPEKFLQILEMQFKNLQKWIIATYRTTMIFVLFIVVAGVLSYLALLLFYATNRNWALPIVLSPTQEKVLSYQPQVASIQADILKNRVNLAIAQAKYDSTTIQIDNLNALIDRFDQASAHEAQRFEESHRSIEAVLKQKRVDQSETAQLAMQMKPLLASIHAELQAGLITKTEATNRRIAIQSMLNTLTDSRAAELDLSAQNQSSIDASQTLGKNGASSLTALQSVTSETQLKAILAQAVVDAETARLSVDQLQKTLDGANRVLAVAKQSPYYAALSGPIAVSFMPYENIGHAVAGAPVFDCYLQVIACHQVGTVDRVYDAEEYGHAPLFKTDIKGKLIGLHLTNPGASESNIVFVGHKPLLF